MLEDILFLNNKTKRNTFFLLPFWIAMFGIGIIFFTGCKDSEEEDPVFETGTVTDVEGNVYATIKIGDQWWMAEDLRTTTFRSGVPIDQVSDNREWKDAIGPAYTTYNNNTLLEGLGMLYNYQVVTSLEEIAPDGWHVPTDEEWKELETYLGMDAADLDKTNWRGTDEGDRLKVEATEGWLFYEGVWANNETGFSAYGGSSRFYEGPFGVPGIKGSAFWWAADANQGYGWYRYLDYKKSGIFRYFGHPNYGFSIRCVKNE